jgi:hypothetical protein
MTSTRHYQPEELLTRAQNLTAAGHPIWLSVENEQLLVWPVELRLATHLAASYHNQIAYNVPVDDGFIAETHYMEQRAQEHMEAPDDDDEGGDWRPHDGP